MMCGSLEDSGKVLPFLVDASGDASFIFCPEHI